VFREELAVDRMGLGFRRSRKEELHFLDFPQSLLDARAESVFDRNRIAASDDCLSVAAISGLHVTRTQSTSAESDRVVEEEQSMQDLIQGVSDDPTQ
jgi:hypothetical protein